jgi:hypothetical protein
MKGLSRERPWPECVRRTASNHPDGEVTLAWTVAQDLMDPYRHNDPELGRTLHAWQGPASLWCSSPWW